MEEIKAGDIMLNNWFHVNGYPMYVEAIFRDTVYLEFKGNEGDVWEESIKDLVPIPLTEDILLKCGAKRIEENKVAIMLNDPSTHLILMKIGTHWYPQIEQVGEFISDGVNVVCLNFIDYVHQAQNLFKAITQTDLIFKI